MQLINKRLWAGNERLSSLSLFEDVVRGMMCYLGTDPSVCHTGDKCALLVDKDRLCQHFV